MKFFIVLSFFLYSKKQNKKECKNILLHIVANIL